MSEQSSPFEMDGLLDNYDPVPSLVARGVMADPRDHDPDSCEYACCVTPLKGDE